VLQIPIIVICTVALHYIADVLIGASIDTYASETGTEAARGHAERLSNFEFFTRVVPFVTLSLGLPMGISLICC
jgi:hypothetical protein